MASSEAWRTITSATRISRLFSHFIACGVWEAVYILDGLLKNQSALQPDTLYADTHGQAEPVFGLASLMGIKLMPRMRNLERCDVLPSGSGHDLQAYRRLVHWGC